MEEGGRRPDEGGAKDAELNLAQPKLEVRDQIVDVLQPHAEPQQSLRDAAFEPHRFGEALMRGRGAHLVLDRC